MRMRDPKVGVDIPYPIYLGNPSHALGMNAVPCPGVSSTPFGGKYGPAASTSVLTQLIDNYTSLKQAIPINN